jgi:hypothetical protein
MVMRYSVVGVFLLVLFFALAGQASARGGFDLKHVCTTDSGREKFRVLNNNNSSERVRLVTAFNDKVVELGPLTGDIVRARVSQGNGKAELIKQKAVVDTVYATYKPCN